MIMVLAGTKDGRILAEKLFERGFPILATTVTEYGARLFQKGIAIRTGPLNKENFRQVIAKNNVELIIDATHPYAQDISETAIAVSNECKVKYLRYERKNTLQEYSNIIHVKDINEAVRILRNYQRIFLTTGSKTLDRFAELLDRGKHFIARVLPKSEIIKKCEEIGLFPGNIIAMKGPFSSEMNYQMFKEYKADVIVTKDSGIIGGVPEKIEAASRLRLPVVIIDRPAIDYPVVINDMEELIRKVCDLHHNSFSDMMKHGIYLPPAQFEKIYLP